MPEETKKERPVRHVVRGPENIEARQRAAVKTDAGEPAPKKRGPGRPRKNENLMSTENFPTGHDHHGEAGTADHPH